jgi:Skp family chaperone for outer membrane proteins
MKRLLALAMMSAFAVAATPAFAAEKAAAENPQQNKMKMCQTQAGEKKLEGKDRQAYVNDCLKAKPEKKESKMAMCNKQTAGLKGDERSKAQSECMKGG